VVGGSVGVEVAASVRVGRVDASSVPLGTVRVPERSVVERVADSLPPPVPQPLSQRTIAITSPVRIHALTAGRPPAEGPSRRHRIQDTGMGYHLRRSQGRRGTPAWTAAILRPAARPRHHPMRVRCKDRHEMAEATPPPGGSRASGNDARGRAAILWTIGMSIVLVGGVALTEHFGWGIKPIML
jgi:hypothetical protein